MSKMQPEYLNTDSNKTSKAIRARKYQQDIGFTADSIQLYHWRFHELKEKRKTLVITYEYESFSINDNYSTRIRDTILPHYRMN